MKEGDTLDVMGPLGNGFDLEKEEKRKPCCLEGESVCRRCWSWQSS